MKADITAAVRTYLEANPPAVDVVDTRTNRIDRTVDGALIRHLYVTLKVGKLTQDQKEYARSCYVQRVRA